MAQRPPMHLDPHSAGAAQAADLPVDPQSESELERVRERIWSGQIIAMPTRKTLHLQTPQAGATGPAQARGPAPANNYRPPGYDYLGILKERLDGDMSRIFNGEMVYPRQLEFHLAANGKERC